MIELVLVEIEPAYQSADRAVLRRDRNERALHLRQLDDGPTVIGSLHDAHDGAGTDARVRLRARTERSGGEAQPVSRDRNDRAVGKRGLNFTRFGRGHHGRCNIAVVGTACECIGDRLCAGGAVSGQHDKGIGAAVAAPCIVIHQAAPQRAIAVRLIGRIDRRDDIEPARVGLVAVLREHRLPHHFGDILGMHAELLHRAFDDD